MSCLEQTLWMEEACKINGRGSPRGMVYGVGVNDADYCQQPRIDGKRVWCPAYVVWKSMLARSCDTKFHAKQPTYSGVKACDEWQSFMSFRKWWLENQVDGWHIDKDMLSDDGVYSPESCVFVPQWLNNLTTDSGAARGDYPIGVYFERRRGRFVALCRKPMSKKQEYLGLFDTPEAAHLAWRTRKLELAIELKPKMDEIDQRIHHRVVEIIMKAR